MEICEGFIVDVFNYCDRWCEACPFTSRCRLFADMAECSAALDRNLQAVVEAPPLPQDVSSDPPEWVQQLIEELNAASAAPMSPGKNEELRQYRREAAPEHQPIQARARDYAKNVHAWLRERQFEDVHDPGDPRAVIAWFHILVPSKVARALKGLAHDEPELRDRRPDHDGSAKVALHGIERSHVAWLQVAERGLASNRELEPFLADLVWLGEELERVFPNARAFVRPAFDEPEEVARLLAMEVG
jgi:hypothetical protein